MSLERKPDGSLVLSRDVALPEILDVLIVGGGPAGTAAAFRARELGRSALVVDMDDILSRIRDYAKSKPILPSYGRGDRMKFPLGDELFNALHFEPIDKDAMHDKWKGYYHEFSIPARTGAELTGLEWDDTKELWIASVRNSNLKTTETLVSKAVILAVGRGVPRRFDIPGDLDNLAFRFTDPSLYIDGPACVIGGGTSAAEAVIAISNAKLAAEAEGDVYWSYRGTKLPKVSAALAEPFFEAYVGNGNVRYFRQSEPQAVAAGDDKREYLSVRVDRRSVSGRPAETTNLEFPIDQCVACIGEDIPVGLLASMGIHLRSKSGSGAKRLTVSPILETHRPNLFLIGDTLSDSYLETGDFSADPAGLKVQRRPGNIKMALRDGFVAMEVIHQRLDGKRSVEIEIRWAKDEPEDKTTLPFRITAGEPGDFGSVDGSDDRSGTVPVPVGASSGKSSRGETGVSAATAFLVRVLPGGVEEDEYPLDVGKVATIGRDGATISRPDDSLLAELHASVVRSPDGFTLRDDGSSGGVFKRLRSGTETVTPSGAMIRVGQQHLRFWVDGAKGGFDHFDREGNDRGTHALGPNHVYIGRKDTDIVLDAGDATLSRRHLSAAVKDGSIVVTDHHSANGSWTKIAGSAPLEDGDEFRAGRQTFRLKTETTEEVDLATESSTGDESVIVSTPSPSPPPKPIEGITVEFAGSGESFEANEGDAVLDVAQDNELPIESQCLEGSCGFDPIRVLEGMENLSEKGETEAKYLAEKGHGPDCRFACVAFPKGPVKVEILKR